MTFPKNAESAKGLAELKKRLAPRYVVRNRLGEGGMATVYRATDTKLECLVAIKVLKPELATEVGVGRFSQEIRVTARLKHPNIITVLDSGEIDGLPFYVMEFVEGESLASRIERDVQLPLEEAMTIARQAASALDTAHRAGTIHRDVKPGNILLSNGHVRVADFGIAKVLGDLTTEQLTAEGTALGTIAYMSPEQVAGDKRLDYRTDIYSLGAVVYEALTGEPPYTGATRSVTVAKILSAPVPSCRTSRHTIPTGVDTAVRRALAKVPADRFKSAGQFVQALEQGVESREGVRGRKVPVGVASMIFLAALIGTVWLLATFRESRVGESTAQQPDPSRIAVLYFDDLSPDGSLGHVARGFTEDLIGRLSSVEALYVISPEGVRPFRESTLAPDSVASVLSVGSIVGGSVAASGDELRVRVRLVEARTARELFGRTFSSVQTDIFAMQDSIAEEVARFLRRGLGREVHLRDRRHETASPEAWNLVNMAAGLVETANISIRQGVNHLARSPLNSADSLLQLAAELDQHWSEPHIARGWVAFSLAFLGDNSTNDITNNGLSRVWLRESIRHADRALDIDSTAHALALKGEVSYRLSTAQRPIDTSMLIQAEVDLTAALAADVSLARAWFVLGSLQSETGRSVLAYRSFGEAHRHDAYLENVRDIIQQLFLGALQLERFDEAAQWCHTGLSRFPADVRFVDCELAYLGWSGRGKEDIDRAVNILKRVEASDTLGIAAQKAAYRRGWLAALYARSGQSDNALQYIDSAVVAARMGAATDPSYITAYTLLLLDRTKDAAQVLHEYVTKFPDARPFLATHPWFKSVSGTPDFHFLSAAF